jgi:ABC-type lipoprotein export system ATPase subunit
LQLLQHINRSLGLTIILITHDRHVAQICHQTLELRRPE